MPPPPSPPPAPPVSLPAAPVAPGPAVVNTLAPPGLVARLHSDYERNGTLDSTEPEHLVRLIRPGSILLPNLDISDRTRIPSPPPADLATLIDSVDDDINGKDDEDQLTQVDWQSPAGVASRAESVVLRLDAKDAARVRMFFELGGAVTFTGFADPANPEFILANSAIAFDKHFLIEAMTLPGDPKLPAPTGPSPAKPQPPTRSGKAAPFDAKLPSGSSGSPIFAKRAPADVWVEVIHKDSADKDLKSPREVALFTIAPFLLLCGVQGPKRVFVVNVPETSDPVTGDVSIGNHNFIFDLAEACQSVFASGTVALPADSSAPFTPSTPASTGPFYLIDGLKFPDVDDPLGRPDPWIQDEIEIGYCFGPPLKFMHVVLHCKRSRGLHNFVHAELLAPKVGLFDSLHAGTSHKDSVHYGGNLEATPAIKSATPALGAGAAGPAVKAHPPAPFGKVLLGDVKGRKVDADYRDFLIAQHIQPVLPIDTSWLGVGHVDEIISFVADSSPKGFKLLFASTNAMTVLLQEIKKVDVSAGRTNFHRGKTAADYDETSVEDFLANTKAFNDRVRTEKLIPIDQRLKSGLNLTDADIIRIPVYFQAPATALPKLSDTPTVAQTVGMVNMLVLGSHLMIPKPFGPRMSVPDAQAVLKRAFAKLGIKATPVMPVTGDIRWVEPEDFPDRVVCYYTDAPTAADRQNIIDHIKDPSVALSPANDALVAARAIEIAAANAGNPAFQAELVPAISGSSFTSWLRVIIPDDKVDVIEAYMLSVLTPLGATVHFVDDWFYHRSEGEAHCATNAIRDLPEERESKRWWDKYDPSVDLSYSP